MDLLEVKTRIAKALVESIFRRARYQVSQDRLDATPRLRFGRDNFSPDFEVRLDADGAHKEFQVVVKYRPHIDQFVSVESQRGERSIFHMGQRQWPSLCFVFVTDRPEAGRSCFQAVPIWTYDPGVPCRSVDLADVEELGIFPRNVGDHEELARGILGPLSAI
ncbi:MAG: hypothetical protein ACE5JD_02970 [Candidatus Methylomirabilia bacterium]